MDKLFFTEEHEMLRDMVRDFAENEVEPLAREMDKTENIPRSLIDKMGELGIMLFHYLNMIGLMSMQ